MRDDVSISYDSQPLELLDLCRDVDVDVDVDADFFLELLCQVFCSYRPCPVL